VLPCEIHHQICHVYGNNAMSDGMVRKWVRMFNEVRENVQDGARMAANMCKNSLKNVTSDNNKILHETLLDLFYSETALTF